MDTHILDKKLGEQYWLSLAKDIPSYSIQDEDLCSSIKVVGVMSSLDYYNGLSQNSLLAKRTIILSLCSSLLNRYFYDFHGHIASSDFYCEATISTGLRPLLFRIPIDRKSVFKKVLQNTKEEVELVHSYRDYNRNRLKNKLGDRELSSFTEFGILFTENVENNPSNLFNINFKNKDEKYEMWVDYSNRFTNGQLANHFVYNLERWLLNLENFMNIVVAEIPILLPNELDYILSDFNDTKRDYPESKTIVDIFESQVKKKPDAIAVIFKNKRYTYSEINQRANQLANYLVENIEVGRGDIVGVLMPKSYDALISILSILKAGCVYLPIDIKYPMERIEYIIGDSKPKVLICNGGSSMLDAKIKSVNIEAIDLSKPNHNIIFGNVKKSYLIKRHVYIACVFYHHPLWPSCGTRSIDDIGQICW